MKNRLLLPLLFLSLLIISCSKDNDDQATITADEASVNSKIDLANDDISMTIEDEFTATLINPDARNAQATTALPNCATVTRVPAFGTMPQVGQTVTKTIDFGVNGCPLTNGNVLKGKIILSFVYQPNAITQTLNVSFVDFYHNLHKIEGTKTFVRTMTQATAAYPSHPIVTMTMNIFVTRPNGMVLNRVGTRTREITAGYSTAALLDNEYTITGNWTTTYPNTVVQTSTISSPLLVKLSCMAQNKPLIVQGVISFVRNNNVATLDYGNGTCDNLAVFTINGNAFNIVIGN